MREANKKIKDQMARYHSSDPATKQQAIDEIVEDYRKFITHLINKHFSTYIAKLFEDMFSVGVVGLLSALEKYDPKKSMPTTFFGTYIVHDIYEFIANFIGHTTPHYAMKIALINRAKAEFDSEGNHNPSIIDLAMRTGLKPELILKSLSIQEASHTQSYDSEDYIMGNISSEPELLPETMLIEKEGKSIIRKALEGLPKEMCEIVKRKLGIDGYEPQSNEQISLATGIKARQVRHLYSKALERLRGGEIANFFKDQYKAAPYCAKESVALIPEDSAARMISALLEYDNEGNEDPIE